MAWDPVWENVFKGQEWGKYPPEGLIRFIVKNFYDRDRKKTKILELGCGPGANVWYMAREGFDVYGIDGSAAAVGIATRRIRDDSLRADLRAGDIARLPYQDAAFDAVVDIECLYCNSRKDTEGILAEVGRAIKPGGLFYSRTFASDSYIGDLYERAGHLEYNSIGSGPFLGKGFVRLSDRDSVFDMYGRHFDIISLDKVSRTIDNERIKISEWDVVCRKRK